MNRRQYPEGDATRNLGRQRSQSFVATSSGARRECCSNEAESGVFAAVRPVREGIAPEQLDLDARVVWIDGETIYLRPMERRLLALLLASPNRVVTSEELIAALYGDISMDAGRVRLRRLVSDIRGRLGANFSRDLRTIHRVGLVLSVQDHSRFVTRLVDPEEPLAAS